jgi:1-acyl-sn-glycerol-3-phosphate acyltransferase
MNTLPENVHSISDRDQLEVDHIGNRESFGTTVRRRIGGRFPIDAFGFDPQIVDFVTPAFDALIRVEVEGGVHVPTNGPAALVANRGFGIFEPAVLGIAVRRAVARRLRIVGAPEVPAIGGLVRRLGAISSSAPDMRACLRAGNLVAVPLAPTWLRTGAGIPPRPLLQAMTNAPIVPVAVTPGGPFGTAIGPWRVRFGPLVTLPDPYDPGDPLAAARFGEAVRDAVSTLLEQSKK